MALVVDTLTPLPILTLTVTTEDANEKWRRFVRRNGNRAGAGESVLGVGRVRSSQIGDDIPVDVAGVILVEAGAVVAIDADVASDADGRAITHAGAAVTAGVALVAAAAAGDFIPILAGLRG